jgi:hypothetical protein
MQMQMQNQRYGAQQQGFIQRQGFNQQQQVGLNQQQFGQQQQMGFAQQQQNFGVMRNPRPPLPKGPPPASVKNDTPEAAPPLPPPQPPSETPISSVVSSSQPPAALPPSEQPQRQQPPQQPRFGNPAQGFRQQRPQQQQQFSPNQGFRQQFGGNNRGRGGHQRPQGNQQPRNQGQEFGGNNRGRGGQQRPQGNQQPRNEGQQQKREGDWDCKECSKMNFGFRTDCKWCQAPKQVSNNQGQGGQGFQDREQNIGGAPSFNRAGRGGRGGGGGDRGDRGGRGGRGGRGDRGGRGGQGDRGDRGGRGGFRGGQQGNDWHCIACEANNSATRQMCIQCNEYRSGFGNNQQSGEFGNNQQSGGQSGGYQGDDWDCISCDAKNSGTRRMCMQCNHRKPPPEMLNERNSNLQPLGQFNQQRPQQGGQFNQPRPLFNNQPQNQRVKKSPMFYNVLKCNDIFKNNFNSSLMLL